MNTHFFVPILNGFRFYYPDTGVGQLSRQEYNAVDYVGLNVAGYCQKALKAVRKIQFQTNFDNITVRLLDINSLEIATYPAVEVFDATASEGYKFYEADIDLSAQPNGYYKVQIEVDDGVTFVDAISEWIQLADIWPNTVLIDFTNDLNDFEIYWDNEFVAQLLVEGLIHQRTPGSTRNFFINSKGLPSVLSAKFQRKAKLYFYNLPPYLYEQLQIGFMCSTATIDNEPYVSEEGLPDPEYKPQHYLLSNNNIILWSKIGQDNDLSFNALTFNIIDNNNNDIVDNFGNNLVWKK